MTLPEAYRILRRYEDWCTDKDCRTSDDALYEPWVHEAIKTILKPRGLGKPLIDCDRCRHAEWPPRGAMAIKPGALGCKLHVRGECTKFEEVKK